MSQARHLTRVTCAPAPVHGLLQRTDAALSGSREPRISWHQLMGLVLVIASLCPRVTIRAAEGTTAPEFAGSRPFVIRVVDQDTRRGVPLVELRTTSEISCWTDSAGVVAFSEPGLMDRDVFFEVRSHGYEFPADGFGFRGKALRTTPGATAEIQVKRLNVAERLYRVTGQGLYRDSILAGSAAPVTEPLLNGLVVGQDTVVAMPFEGRIHWFWGDTERPAHPLGHFGASGAVSDPPRSGGLDPSVGVNLRYYVDAAGFSRPVCPDPAQGMRWIEGLMVVKDPSGRERLLARYAVMKDLGHAQEWILGSFDAERGRFDPVVRYDVHTPHTSAHPFRVNVDTQAYWYLFPTLRVAAQWQSITNPAAYESFTCLMPGQGTNPPSLERDGNGSIQYRWRNGFAPFTPDAQEDAVKRGRLDRSENWHCLVDVDTGTPLRTTPVRGSVCWNPFVHSWIGLFSGEPGEVWYAEADTPVGPWVYARRVVTHDRYNFYNPAQHPFFDQEFGRVIYFEGTYTATFSAAPAQTPRYDYNQVMYRMKLDDTRLCLPAPVYELESGPAQAELALRENVEANNHWDRVRACRFFAWSPNRRRAGLVPIYALGRGMEFRLSPRPREGEEAWALPLFYALAPEQNPDALPLDGAWRCVGDMPSGTKHDYGWELRTEGTRVAGRFDPDSVFRVANIEGGTFRDQDLELQITHAGARYAVKGRVRDGKMDGTWKRLDEDESGTWSGTAVDRHPRPAPNASVAPLFEYLHKPTGRRTYRIDADWKEPGWQRSAQPLCRVLRNPQRALILDASGRAP